MFGLWWQKAVETSPSFDPRASTSRAYPSDALPVLI